MGAQAALCFASRSRVDQRKDRIGLMVERVCNGRHGKRRQRGCAG
jgi:hypothetical protein